MDTCIIRLCSDGALFIYISRQQYEYYRENDRLSDPGVRERERDFTTAAATTTTTTTTVTFQKPENIEACFQKRAFPEI
jgi:hypothetical protein